MSSEGHVLRYSFDAYLEVYEYDDGRIRFRPMTGKFKAKRHSEWTVKPVKCSGVLSIDAEGMVFTPDELSSTEFDIEAYEKEIENDERRSSTSSSRSI